MRAIISVYNKTGISDFAGGLLGLGWELYATGGTLRVLADNGISAREISGYTGYPELLGGKIKTLHPRVFAGILSSEDQAKEISGYGALKFDLVCCNFYSFGEANDLEEASAGIDIGGPAMLRAAAKNFSTVAAVSDPADYGWILEKFRSGGLDPEDRKRLAAKAFRLSCSYDHDIFSRFSDSGEKERLEISAGRSLTLRYGENSHQKAEFYGDLPFRLLRGEKPLGFNNIQDTDAAVRLVGSFGYPSAAVIKHAVPCGAAGGKDILEAYSRALASDPMSAFGGIVAVSDTVDAVLAEKLTEHFLEVVAAPGFTWDALNIFEKKPNLRVIQYGPGAEDGVELRAIGSGYLRQDRDSFNGELRETVTRKAPSGRQMEDLEFAWKVAAFLKSNAIVLAANRQTCGLGSGETARVWAVKTAAAKMREFVKGGEEGLVMASDGFFPFPDSIEEAAAVGVTAVIQPGGSKNDAKVVEAADRLGLSMVFTGRRHFRH